ncbi:Phytoene synthase/Lycopene cyclase [Podospora australis]|uniref:Bifunctional lycopene cyclase/phytoene synthase n=1 Tax=Podospora australis TaxID=1536484 RepID=A0AAN7AK95_9PEZI|nr:Phytoene synthase/Lycopene cyclase [Podospora australis]
MAYDYALVHLKFTIPLALFLTAIAYPILHRTHFLQITSLVVLSFVATLPWDSYLIRNKIWSYPPDTIIGPRLYGIPMEELFFFVIQTYITSLFYIILSKPLFHPLYLQNQRNPPRWIARGKLIGQGILIALTLYGAHLVRAGGPGTYLGLIMAWAFPFALLTFTVAGRFILSLPLPSTALPVLLPTIYLWLVDELALGRGTWAIESGTKLGFCLFGVLEIEEATFFLATNLLIVFGLAVFDQYLAVIFAFPHLFPTVPRSPTPLMLVESRLLDKSQYDLERIAGLSDAVLRLRRKSRSFYLANSLFTGRLRIDLILLYSFCRLADDLVDDSQSRAEVRSWTAKLNKFLDLHYKSDPKAKPDMDLYITEAFPPSAKSALKYLPVAILPAEPLYQLIEGFEMDSQFDDYGKPSSSDKVFPITNEERLNRYGQCVAGTVGELCVALIIEHCEPDMPAATKQKLRAASRQMGVALQYVNIARDIVVDAEMGRVYLPTTWLKEAGLTPEDVVARPSGPVIEKLRRRLLTEAFKLYAEARPEMDAIPSEARGPMIGAVETYMEIGRVLREKDEFTLRKGKATVPAWRRLRTVLAAIYTK